MNYDGVGGAPMDDVAKYGEWRGPGPMTQVAVFERIAATPPPSTAVPASVLAHEVVWSSSSDAGPVVAAAQISAALTAAAFS